MGRINKIRRLLTVNGLLEMSVKKGVLHIQLMNRPLTRGSNAQHSPNRSLLNHRAECLIIINTRLLIISPSNPASLMLREGTIYILISTATVQKQH
jgi:hypothetical protein